MSMEDLWLRQSVHGWVLFLGIKSVYRDKSERNYRGKYLGWSVTSYAAVLSLSLSLLTGRLGYSWTKSGRRFVLTPEWKRFVYLAATTLCFEHQQVHEMDYQNWTQTSRLSLYTMFGKDVLCPETEYVKFVVQSKYTTWQVQNEKESWFAETMSSFRHFVFQTCPFFSWLWRWIHWNSLYF